MIVRTYGRRNRSLNDPVSDNDDPFSFSLSEENNTTTITANKSNNNNNNNNNSSSQDFYTNFPFSSQESSSSLWPSFDDPDLDPYSKIEPRKSKKQRNGSKFERPSSSRSNKALVPLTSTLMEAQEFGEMMEHVDEVNFALDGLRKCQPVRIRRASLLSLLSICSTAQQRRLLSTNGMVKTIIDAILDLNPDDSPSNLAAVTLLYALTYDGQDDHLLESSSCVRFLIKLMKPVVPNASEDKGRNIGSKLLALRKDSDSLRDTSKLVDSNSAAIAVKVEEILVSCKELNPHDEENHGTERPELNPKWISLLTVEKACLSKIYFDDISGAVRKMGGDFKEKLRELGGLDAVFEVIMNCYSVMEKWMEKGAPSCESANLYLRLQSLVLLLKCLKIMENATFLSSDNQSHLLGMKGPFDAQGRRLSFTRIILSVIKILSSLSLLKNYSTTSNTAKNLQNGNEHALALDANGKEEAHEVICISSSTSFSSTERTSSRKNCSLSQKSSASTSETTATCRNGVLQLRLRPHPSAPSSCSEGLRSTDSRKPVMDNGSKISSALIQKPDHEIDELCKMLGGSQDPYAFDEDDFQPSKWDLLYGKRKKLRPKSVRITSRTTSRELKHDCQDQLRSQEESCNGAICQNSSSNLEHEDSHSQNISLNKRADEDYSNLLADCLLTAIKVLMNLTNENSVGCQQIAACEGLETMSSLIADHFPSFSLPSSFINEMKEDSSSVELDYQRDNCLTDQELDFLVAILGLLVNLVEKDGHNRLRLATASVPLHCPGGLESSGRRDVITLLCSIFLANQGAGDATGDGNIISWNDESAVLQGEKEAEKMIVEAYAALLLAFLSTESQSIRSSITDCLPNHNLAILVPVLERFVAFHLTLNMISPETHKAVNEVIESCRIP